MNSYRTENYIKRQGHCHHGASSGFGKETAKKRELGGKVVLAARREELLRELRRRSVKAAARLPTSRPMFV